MAKIAPDRPRHELTNRIRYDTVWLAGIGCIPTDEGWLYLAAVKDLATMKIVGWSMDFPL